MNNVDGTKVNGILGRVCAALATGNTRTFSQEEEEKLSNSLGLNAEDTQYLIQTVTHIIQQAAHGLVRPGVLGEHLTACKVSEEKASLFVEQWSTNAKPIIDTLKQQSLSQKQLSDISWDLNIETASSTRSRQGRAISVLQLSLATPETKGDTTQTEKVLLQFDHNQLYNFYDQLEKVQTQLDALR